MSVGACGPPPRIGTTVRTADAEAAPALPPRGTTVECGGGEACATNGAAPEKAGVEDAEIRGDSVDKDDSASVASLCCAGRLRRCTASFCRCDDGRGTSDWSGKGRMRGRPRRPRCGGGGWIDCPCCGGEEGGGRALWCASSSGDAAAAANAC